MRELLVLGLVAATLSTLGGNKRVPNDIVQKSLKSALQNAPATASAMCGANVKGLSNATITAIKRGENNVGTAHVSGTPSLGAGAPPSCEGDVEFSYTYSQATTGYKKRTTTTTWSLDHLTLVAVQTKGVTFERVDETPDDGEP